MVTAGSETVRATVPPAGETAAGGSPLHAATRAAHEAIPTARRALARHMLFTMMPAARSTGRARSGVALARTTPPAGPLFHRKLRSRLRPCCNNLATRDPPRPRRASIAVALELFVQGRRGDP